jgi:hypothetical protein
MLPSMPRVETILLLLRVTAFTSAVCLGAAMVAEAYRARPSPWLRALAVSHTLHLALVVMRGVAVGGIWMPPAAVAVTVLLGGTAYVFIYLLAWRGQMDSRLLSFGAYYIWAIFFIAYAGNAARKPSRGPVAVALIAALITRAVARRKNAVAARSAG